MQHRELGKRIIQTTSAKQIMFDELIEELIHTKSDNDSCVYKHIIHQSFFDMISGKPRNQLIDELQLNQTGWDHPYFKDLKLQMDEQDSFIEKPFEVEEGVLTCLNMLKNGSLCKSKRVIYYQLQQRSSDEPMTTFANCCACGHKWQYSG